MALSRSILTNVGRRVLEIIDSLVENWLLLALLAGLLWALFRLRQLEARVEARLEARLEQVLSQQTNLVDAKVSLEAELTAIKADISWLSEDCFKTPRPVKL